MVVAGLGQAIEELGAVLVGLREADAVDGEQAVRRRGI
jgi:hypothetical protein